MGLSGTIRSTPIAMIIVVTIDEVAIAIVDIISPSSLFTSALAFSRAFIAQGSFRFEILPVTNERYEPPAPSIGIKVITSTIPTAQYIGAVATSPLPRPSQSGADSKINATATGKARSIIIIVIFHILPSR